MINAVTNATRTTSRNAGRQGRGSCICNSIRPKQRDTCAGGTSGHTDTYTCFGRPPVSAMTALGQGPRTNTSSFYSDTSHSKTRPTETVHLVVDLRLESGSSSSSSSVLRVSCSSASTGSSGASSSSIDKIWASWACERKRNEHMKTRSFRAREERGWAGSRVGSRTHTI